MKISGALRIVARSVSEGGALAIVIPSLTPRARIRKFETALGLCSTVTALSILACPSAAQEGPEAPRGPVVEQGLQAQQDYSPYPSPDAGYVTDIVGLLTVEEEERIERWLWQVEAETGVEMAVVTIGSINDYPGADNATIESFAMGLFNRYGVGNLPNNDGVLLLVAQSDREARIELGKAYGLSHDTAATRIMQGVIIPQFKKGRYARGVTSGVQAMIDEFAEVRIGVNWPLVAMLIAFPVLSLIAFSLFMSGKRGWGWICVGILIVLALALFRTLRARARSRPSRYTGRYASWGDSGGSSSSWSSGGFGGGFGGGSSGGGGATGSW